MTVKELLDSDAAALRDALSGVGPEISVTLSFPREVAERVLQLVDAERKGGAIVMPAQAEFTTSEAAAMLRVSRPFLIKLIEVGEIEHRMVGTHRRIPARAIAAYKEHDLALRSAAMDELAELSNELGLVE